MPPAQNRTTGSLPALATLRTRSSGACSSLAAVASSESSSDGDPLDLAGDLAHVAHGLDDVARPGLALGADHRRALRDPPQRLAEVGRAAHERDLERPLVDVVGLVGGREDLGLVDVVDLERLQHLGLDEVADAGLRHHRDRHGLLDPLDEDRVRHARDAAVTADVGGDALERHHGGRAGVLGDLGLLGVDDVHDDAALEHLGQPGLDAESRLVAHASHGSRARERSPVRPRRAVARRCRCTDLLEAERPDAVVVLRRVAGVDPVGQRLQDREQADVRAHEGRRVRGVVERAVRELGDLGERRVDDRQRGRLAVAGDLHRAHDQRMRAAGAEADHERLGVDAAEPGERLLRRRGGDLRAHVEQHQQVAQVGGEERHLVGAGDQHLLVGGDRLDGGVDLRARDLARGLLHVDVVGGDGRLERALVEREQRLGALLPVGRVGGAVQVPVLLAGGLLELREALEAQRLREAHDGGR